MLFILRTSNLFQKLFKNIFLKISKKKNEKSPRIERKISELKKKNKKKKLASSKIVTSEAFERVTDETLQESHLKIGKSLAPRSKHKIFELKKKEHFRIMEYRISFKKKKKKKKKKTQRSSFKITTCERFQMVNNLTRRFTGAMSSQATAWHHVTGHWAHTRIFTS